MTDKSFGDHMNRNIVKNPLLSTAVTGLSVADLTQNAVLLPVSRSQEVITRPDLFGAQTQPLGYSENVPANIPSGDTNSNTALLNPPFSISPSPLNLQQNIKIEKHIEKPCATQSKALTKSDDDFDVSEYFARLHGTRYVSAPLNCGLKEDQNTALEETEENLEEINLNESQTDIHQSITADIAQNFSQLPTVLPQVASAVFSSFSNMLNLKSRENTPDEIRPSHEQFHRSQEENVQLLGMTDPVKETAPPPREPPIVGTGNYRLSTKKKYAQIPGLSSGDAIQMPLYNPVSQNTPTYFIPPNPVATEINPQITDKANPDSLAQNETYAADFQASEITVLGTVESAPKFVSETSGLSQFNNQNTASSVIQPLPNTSVFPPPPTSIPRRDTGIGRSILPPSVARRISSNHPVIKTPQVSAFSDHIFVPASNSVDINRTDNPAVVAPSTVTPFNTQPAELSIFTPDIPLPSSSPNVAPVQAGISVPLFTTGNTSQHIIQNTSILDVNSAKVVAAPITTLSSPNIIAQPVSQISSVHKSSSIPPPSIEHFTTRSSAAILQPPPATVFNQAPINLLPPLSGPKTKIESPSTLPPNFPPSTLESSNVTSTLFTPNISVPQTRELEPPMFFNPSTLNTNPSEIHENRIPHFVDNNPEQPPKPVMEPPKASGNVNYRLTKKRPQYYSGPIEGFGSISNNVKPVIQPVETNAFQGALFTPTQNAQGSVEQSLVTPNIDQSTVPFDINRPAENVPYVPFDISKPQTQPEYNTSFDLSRQMTETYEPPKQENKGFGIIGSLKSKLSSVDIKKIQNSVTTFFDPAYNDVKKEPTGTQENVSYDYQQYHQNYQNQNQSSNFEIFVPNVEMSSQQYNQNYDYQTHQNPIAQEQGNEQYQQHSNYYYQTQGQGLYQPSKYSDSPAQQHRLYSDTAMGFYQHEYSATPASNTEEKPPAFEISANVSQQSLMKDTIPNYVQDNVHLIPKSTAIDTSVSFFDSHIMQQELKCENIVSTVAKVPIMSNAQIEIKKSATEEESIKSNSDNKTPEGVTGLFKTPVSETKSGMNVFANFTFDESNENMIIDPDRRDVTSTEEGYSNDSSKFEVSSLPLLGLSTMLADKTKELEDIENDVKNMTLLESKKDVIDRESNLSFFDNLKSIENKPVDNIGDNKEHDLDICETCREVNKPEDRDYDDDDDDLTTQLIENIVSPIQLLNPVEVPLTECNTPVGDRCDFYSNQCAEISHITEETIETIQVQSATELLEEEQTNTANVRDYGWCTDNTPFTTSNLVEHDYSMQMNTNAIGFFGNNSLFMENIPNNASDEIKAEFQFTHEDSPVVLPRQMSIPSAPPAEDDSKSDEAGIDVHSIEQDANKDFPIFEEFVIEPSETDDDKIEYRERERSSDAPEIDSFTNRVERFKKMESNESFDLQKNSIPIASYFDTGNYAAETHYRNSLASPANLGSFSVGSPNLMRIPPGFEEEYQRRLSNLSGLSEHNNSGENNSDIPYSIPYIPDTSTQTRPTFSPTFSTAHNISDTTGHVVFSKMTEFVYGSRPSFIESDKLPDFDDMFEKQHKSPETVTPRNQDVLFEKPHLEMIDAIATDVSSLSLENNKLPDIITSKQQEKHPGNLLFTSEQSSESLRNDSVKYHGDFGIAGPSVDKPDSQMVTNLRAIERSEEPNILLAATIQETYKEIPQNGQNAANPFLELTGSRKEELKFDPPTMFANLKPVGKSEISNIVTSDFHKDAVENVLKLQDISNPFSEVYESQRNIEPTDTDNKILFGDLKPAESSNTAIPDIKTVTETPRQDIASLPDPINFFASTEVSSSTQNNEDTGFNRLASYFTTPTKSDNTKSFFELSQSQDHYRQDSNPNVLGAGDSTTPHPKPFFQLSQSQNHYIDNKTTQNIPQEKHIANLNLIRDLTSLENLEINPDQIVRTVNYFTVEYNNEHLNVTKEFDKGEPETFKRDVDDLKIDKKLMETAEIDEKHMIDVIKHCKCCCNMNSGYVKKFDNLDHEAVLNKTFKVKKAMDGNSEVKKDSDSTDSQSDKNGDGTRTSVTVSFGGQPIQEDSNEGVSAMIENRPSSEYIPVKHHWFFRVDIEGKSTWRGFSVVDSKALEDAFLSPDLDDSTVVPTDGGRFDVNIVGRLRVAVYWSDKPTNVRRCSWFYKGTTDARYVPYTEAVAEKLEEEYRHGVTTGEWHRRLILPNNEMVVMHGPAVMVHFLQSCSNDAFSAPPQSTTRPRVVRRGHEETEIEDVEPSNIDHLLLLCHGVGSACDMRFRSVEEVVDDFRATSLQLLQSHYRHSYESGVVGRVEVLPISWHATLHSGETGVDRRLARITLDSIPRLRSFTNDTVLDVLFYTSPVFCQTIIDTVCSELNRIYRLFRARNPNFLGGVSLGGHSLGSVILYDLLGHQAPLLGLSKPSTSYEKKFVNGAAGTGQPTVRYPRLEFEPVALYALGSPIAIFECIRGVESLGPDFSLPTCKNFFNIFHPYDPIAYRIEPLINPQLRNMKPYLIPHHKGRKRMHLELKDTMARVGADIKQKLIESIRSTWYSMWNSSPNTRHLEKVVEEEIEKEQLNEESKDDQPQDETVTPDLLGKLNSGRRIDYVLQEAPLELINEYLFAMSSHVCYWESEDTMLMMLREIYDSLGVQPDCTVPQQGMTVQRMKISKNEEHLLSECPSTSRGAS